MAFSTLGKMDYFVEKHSARAGKWLGGVELIQRPIASMTARARSTVWQSSIATIPPGYMGV